MVPRCWWVASAPSGIPTELLCALLDQGARELTVVNNNGGNGPIGLSQLFLAGRVRKLICSFARSANPLQPSAAAFAEVYRAGKIELECVPQGIMVERMRAAAAGLGPFFSPVSYGSKLAEGKETRVIDGKGMCWSNHCRETMHSSRHSRPTAGATSPTVMLDATSAR